MRERYRSPNPGHYLTIIEFSASLSLSLVLFGHNFGLFSSYKVQVLDYSIVSEVINANNMKQRKELVTRLTS